MTGDDGLLADMIDTVMITMADSFRELESTERVPKHGWRVLIAAPQATAEHKADPAEHVAGNHWIYRNVRWRAT